MDWQSISALTTGGGTLVLAVATFASVRSSQRSARVAERALLAGLAPVLMPSRDEDPPERVMFGDRHWVNVPGHGGVVEATDTDVYLALALRNAGSGPAVLHGWYATATPDPIDLDLPAQELFRDQLRDIYVPAGDTGFWQGRLRPGEDDNFAEIRDAAHAEDLVSLFLLYGDHEGGQRTVARFGLVPVDKGEIREGSVSRYWSLDGEGPRGH
jgi:hypothetical protein